MASLTPWLRRLRGTVPATSLLLVAVVAGLINTESSENVIFDLEGNAVWLPLELGGDIAQFDGSVPQQAARAVVRVTSPGSAIEVAQHRGGALVFDSARGTVIAVDGATHRVDRPRRLFGPGLGEGGDASPTRVVTGTGNQLWAVEGNRARELQPRPLAAIGDVISLPAGVGPDLVAAAGRLWATADGEVFAAGDPEPVAGFGADVRLGSVGDRLLALDAGAGRLSFVFDDDDCRFDGSTEARVHRTETLAVITDPPRGLAVLVDSGCRTSAAVPLTAGIQIGDVVEIGGWIYLVDDERQQIWLVEATTDQPRFATTAQLARPDDSPLRLVASADIVFFNHPTSGVAGVLHPSSEAVEVVPITKPVATDPTRPITTEAGATSTSAPTTVPFTRATTTSVPARTTATSSPITGSTPTSDPVTATTTATVTATPTTTSPTTPTTPTTTPTTPTTTPTTPTTEPAGGVDSLTPTSSGPTSCFALATTGTIFRLQWTLTGPLPSTSSRDVTAEIQQVDDVTRCLDLAQPGDYSLTVESFDSSGGSTGSAGAGFTFVPAVQSDLTIQHFMAVPGCGADADGCQVGEISRYGIDVANNGPDQAEDFRVAVSMPSCGRFEGLTFAGSEVGMSGTAVFFNSAARQLIIQVGTAPPNSSLVDVRFDISFLSVGPCTVGADVLFSGFDPDPANNRATVTLDVNGP